MRRGSVIALAGVVLCMAPWMASASYSAEEGRPSIYKWVDENGVAHYTTDPERIPERLRERIRRLPSASGAEQAESTEPTRSGPAESEPWAEQDAVRPAENGEETVSALGAGSSATSLERVRLEREIAALEAEIARKEELIKASISSPPEAGAVDLAQDPEFRATARRLPELQAELRGLRDQRARLEGASGSEPETEP
jgi:hypothetical protein